MPENVYASFENFLAETRRQIKTVAADVKSSANTVKLGTHVSYAEDGREQAAREDRGEVIANLMLAYRHLEDASMRLGKAIQAHNGGTSVYDRATTVGA